MASSCTKNIRPHIGPGRNRGCLLIAALTCREPPRAARGEGPVRPAAGLRWDSGNCRAGRAPDRSGHSGDAGPAPA